LWPNGWMNQDATWYGGRPQARRLCVTWGTRPLSKKGTEPPIFGPCLLWWNGCMNQDATWYGGRPQPRRHCVRRGPTSPPLKGHSPNFRPMSVVAKRLNGLRCHLVWEGFGPGDFVFDEDPPPSGIKGTASTNFWPIYIVAKRLDGSRCHLVRR